MYCCFEGAGRCQWSVEKNLKDVEFFSAFEIRCKVHFDCTFFLVLVVHYGMTSPRVIWTSSIFRSFHLNFFWPADPKNFDGNFRKSSWGCRLYRYIDILFCITYWYLIHILCLYNVLFPVKISRSCNSINHNVRFIVGDRFVLHRKKHY